MESKNNMKELFGGVIYAYTREQAISDGVLIDVSKMAKEAGIRFPVVLTSAVWHEYVLPDEELKGYSLDQKFDFLEKYKAIQDSRPAPKSKSGAKVPQPTTAGAPESNWPDGVTEMELPDGRGGFKKVYALDSVKIFKQPAKK